MAWPFVPSSWATESEPLDCLSCLRGKVTWACWDPTGCLCRWGDLWGGPWATWYQLTICRSWAWRLRAATWAASFVWVANPWYICRHPSLGGLPGWPPAVCTITHYFIAGEINTVPRTPLGEDSRKLMPGTSHLCQFWAASFPARYSNPEWNSFAEFNETSQPITESETTFRSWGLP